MKPTTPNPLAIIATALALAACGPAYAGLTISLSYDSSVTDLGPTIANEVETATGYAAYQIQSFFSDNITINVDVVAGNSGLGSSSSQSFSDSDTMYGSLYTKLQAHATAANPDEQAALGIGGSVPNTDPATGSGHNWFLTPAQGKALGISDPLSPLYDGTFTFNAGTLGSGQSFDYSTGPNRQPGVNQYDFVGVAEHEISEIMGRIHGDLSGLTTATAAYQIYDLFRYTGTGTRGVTTGSGIYFSINNGTSHLRIYNAPAGGDPTISDPQDWANGQGVDPANAFATLGAREDFSTVDKQAMNVIGYTPVPEPATAGALAAAFVAVAAAGQRCFRRRAGV